MKNNWSEQDIKYLEQFLQGLYESVGPATYSFIYNEIYNNPPQALYAPELLTESTEQELMSFMARIKNTIGAEQYSKFETFLIEWSS